MTAGPAITWLRQSLDDVPRTQVWLSAAEQHTCEAFKFPKRRMDWLLGRWTAKRVLAGYLGIADTPVNLSAFEIRPAADGAPEVSKENLPMPVSISISHSNGCGFSVVGPANSPVGCDVESLAERSDVFVRDYFTPIEQEQVYAAPESSRALLATLIWSAKESTLKVLRQGLRLDTRTVEVHLDSISHEDGWTPFKTSFRDGQRTFDGWWRADQDFVFTLVRDAS